MARQSTGALRVKGRKRRRTHRVQRVLLGVVPFTVLPITLWMLLFLTPPPSLLRGMAATFPSDLVGGSESREGLSRIFGRTLEVYTRSALAAYVAERAQVNDASPAALARAIRAVRETVLTYEEVPHPARTWSALVVGFGYCDQVNAAVGRVSARAFDNVQLYALFDPVRRLSPHTIGRAWSGELKEWIYFDAMFDEPVLFLRHGAAIEFLRVPGMKTLSHETLPAGIEDLYRLPGWVMNEFRPGLGGELAVKFLSVAGLGAVENPPAVDVPPVLPADPVVTVREDDAMFTRMAAIYAAARVEHSLTGEPDRARYLEIANDPVSAHDTRAAEFASAARYFLSHSDH